MVKKVLHLHLLQEGSRFARGRCRCDSDGSDLRMSLGSTDSGRSSDRRASTLSLRRRMLRLMSMGMRRGVCSGTVRGTHRGFWCLGLLPKGAPDPRTCDDPRGAVRGRWSGARSQ